MSLKNLIALQAQKTQIESKQPASVATPHATDGKLEAESLPAAQVESSPPPAKPKGLGLNIAGNFKKPDGPMPVKTPASQKPKPVASEPDVFSLDDLAGMSASDVSVADSGGPESGFDDEIEATAPDRDLPADITAEQISFVESLDAIYGVLHDSEMFGQTVRMIMLELQDNPEYEKLLSDSDVHTMIRGMRRTMGLARVRKQEKSRKVGTQKNARKTSGLSDSAMALMDQLMGGGDD